ncbi:MAG: hypothetical protein KDK26_17115 [Roseivivax sp.]|nr:hypothetical protein [Roseivivax sp.]
MQTATTVAETPPTPLKYSELVELTVKLNNRIDGLWQRVIYAHAAIVAVMVFFATADQPYMLQRFLVLFVYSMNSLVSHLAFRDAYRGLHAAVSDLRRYPETDSQVVRWLYDSDYSNSATLRGLFLAVLWAVIAFLLFFRWLGKL